MDLQLVPLDGERTLTEEEKQRQKRRTRPISPEILKHFTAEQQHEIKVFLSKLIVVSEQFHHDIQQLETSSDPNRLDYLEDDVEKLSENRIALFENQPFFLKYFIKLLHLCPSEPWKELGQFLKNIQDEDIEHYRKVSQSMGIEAALENTYLLQVEEDLKEEHIENQLKCRITPREIEALIIHHPLEVLVKHLIHARRVSSGEFWDKGFYDL